MPRVRHRPIHPFVQKLVDIWRKKMDIPEDQEYTLKDLSNDSGIPYSTLTRWADLTEGHRHLEAVVHAAEACGMTVEDFVKGLLQVA